MYPRQNNFLRFFFTHRQHRIFRPTFWTNFRRLSSFLVKSDSELQDQAVADIYADLRDQKLKGDFDALLHGWQTRVLRGTQQLHGLHLLMEYAFFVYLNQQRLWQKGLTDSKQHSEEVPRQELLQTIGKLQKQLEQHLGEEQMVAKSVFSDEGQSVTTTRVGKQPPPVTAHQKILRKNIEKLWQCCEPRMHAVDFLAQLVVGMLTYGYTEDAKIFTKLFSIPGNSFIQPLTILAKRAENLEAIEDFSVLLQECYFDVVKLNLKNRPRPQREDKIEYKLKTHAYQLTSATEFRSLVWIWKATRRKFKRSETEALIKQKRTVRMHQIDARSLDELANAYVHVWARAAVQHRFKCDSRRGAASFSRCEWFAEQNGIPLNGCWRHLIEEADRRIY